MRGWLTFVLLSQMIRDFRDLISGAVKGFSSFPLFSCCSLFESTIVVACVYRVVFRHRWIDALRVILNTTKDVVGYRRVAQPPILASIMGLESASGWVCVREIIPSLVKVVGLEQGSSAVDPSDMRNYIESLQETNEKTSNGAVPVGYRSEIVFARG